MDFAANSKLDCNYVCSGNNTQICGGSSRMTIYNNTQFSTVTSTSVVSAPTSASTFSEFVYPTGYKGCYTYNTSGRVLSKQAYSSANSTIDMCRSACSALSLSIASAEHGSECWCGSQMAASASLVAVSDCSTACPGNSTTACGAGNRLSIYSDQTTLLVASTPTIVNSTGNYNFLGCFTDSGTRTLPNSVAGGSVEACASSCAGSTYFGVKYGSECYCGSALYTSSTQVATTDCNMPCSNNASEYCGAGNRLQVYQLASSTVTSTSSISSTSIQATSLPTSSAVAATTTNSSSTTSTSAAATPTIVSTNYQGCFHEPSNGRALPNKVSTNGNNTVESCQAACSAAGFTVSGAEYSSECWCGNVLTAGLTKVADSQCNMACSGSSAEFCGGGNLLSVYSQSAVVVSTAPVQPAVIGNFALFGCVSDSSSRTLSDKTPALGSSNSLEACALACSGYQYFGTEYSSECYCGNTLRSGYTNVSLSSCSMTCSGNATVLRCWKPSQSLFEHRGKLVLIFLDSFNFLDFFVVLFVFSPNERFYRH